MGRHLEKGFPYEVNRLHIGNFVTLISGATMNERIMLSSDTDADEQGAGSTGAQTEYMKSLRAGLRVLLEFERGPRDLGVTDIAKRCGLSKSQVSKMLSALIDSGLLEQDPITRTYHIGRRCYILGSRFTTYDSLCQAATPVMRALLNRTGHSVRLSVLHGDQSLYLIGLEGPHFVDTGWRSGNCVPIGASSAGRVMMAFMDAEKRQRLLDLPVPALTSDTITDHDRVVQIVEEAGRAGFAVQRNESTIGLGVISVPLFKADQEVVGALGLAFPSHLIEQRDEPLLIKELHDAARAISQRLGCAVYPIRSHVPTTTA